jgi:hypothetical protein
MATKPWTFQQLGGDRTTLVLAGLSAPHGRPRKNPVVTNGIKLRTQRVYYPDAVAPPTTHIFGIAYDDWELKGRFNDAWLGSGGAKSATNQWIAFVAAAQEVLITWGDVLTARGLVHKFVPGRESEFETAYTIEVHIDEELGVLPLASGAFADPGATSLCEALQLEVLKGVGGIPKIPNAGDLKPSFLDTLDDLVSTVNGLSASLLAVAGEFDTFASGTLDQLDRLRAGVAQMRTAVLRIRLTIDTTANEATMLARSADSDILWFAARANTDVGTLRIMALLDELDRQAEIAQRGRILQVYVARGGDSWESIARQFYGGPQSAGRIRDANGVKYGEAPKPGRSYSIPSTT